MKLCELDMHCGECAAIEFCGAGFGYAICTDRRFSNVDDAEYAKIAELCPPFDGYPECAGCINDECWECDYEDGQKDYNADHFAEYAYQKISHRNRRKERSNIDCQCLINRALLRNRIPSRSFNERRLQSSNRLCFLLLAK